MTAVALSVAGLQTDAGFTRTITNTGSSVSSTTRLGTCSDAMSRDNATWAFLLRDTNSTAANLTAPGSPGSYQNGGILQTGITHATGQSGCTRDPAGYVSVLSTFDGNTGIGGWVNGPAPAGLPANSLTAGYTGEVWFRTTTTQGGNIMALGDTNFLANLAGTPPTLSTKHDHQVVMLANGRLSFAMTTGGTTSQITSTVTYNDNVWHHVVATVSPTAGVGSTLYVDGAPIGTSTTATSGSVDGGVSFLHLGYESLTSLTGAPARWAWTGDLAHAAVYTYPFTATQVLTHYRAGLA